MKLSALFTLAIASLVAANPVPRDNSGCTLSLTSVAPNQAQAGLVIVVGISQRFQPVDFSLTGDNFKIDTLSSTQYSVQLIPSASGNFNETFIASTTPSWIGTYLVSRTTTPSTANGDYFVTAVTCP